MSDNTQPCGHDTRLRIGTWCLMCAFHAERDERIRLEERLKACQGLLAIERDREEDEDTQPDDSLSMDVSDNSQGRLINRNE